MSRTAAILAWVTGFGFGVPAIFGLQYFARNSEIWRFLSFPTYGEGPFERWGIPTSVVLLSGFILVCCAEVVVGALLWNNRISGQWLALAILPFELVYWIGFALPFGPALGLARTILVLILLKRNSWTSGTAI